MDNDANELQELAQNFQQGVGQAQAELLNDAAEEDDDNISLWSIGQECEELDDMVNRPPIRHSQVESKTRFILSRNLFRYAKNDPAVKTLFND